VARGSASSPRERQQVQVVVAQHRLEAPAHRPGALERPAQHLEGARSAADQIADQHQAVVLGVDPGALQQRLERVDAAVDVADQVGGHAEGGPAPGPGGRAGSAPERRAQSTSAW
jgi:hypothetical protein